MNNLGAIYDLLRSDGSIIINKAMSFGIGLNENILFNELIAKHRWYEDNHRLTDDGYFYCTISDLYLSTCLSEKKQRTAIKKLIDLKLILSENRDDKKRYFKVINDGDLILKYINLGKQEMEKEKLGSEAKMKEKAEYNKQRKEQTSDSSKMAESILPPGEIADSDEKEESILPKEQNQFFQNGRTDSDQKAEPIPPKGQTNNTNSNNTQNNTENNTRENNTNTETTPNAPITPANEEPEEKTEGTKELTVMDKLISFAESTGLNEIAVNTWIKVLGLYQVTSTKVIFMCPNEFTKGIIVSRYTDLVQSFVSKEYPNKMARFTDPVEIEKLKAQKQQAM